MTRLQPLDNAKTQLLDNGDRCAGHAIVSSEYLHFFKTAHFGLLSRIQS